MLYGSGSGSEQVVRFAWCGVVGVKVWGVHTVWGCRGEGVGSAHRVGLYG